MQNTIWKKKKKEDSQKEKLWDLCTVQLAAHFWSFLILLYFLYNKYSEQMFQNTVNMLQSTERRTCIIKLAEWLKAIVRNTWDYG